MAAGVKTGKVKTVQGTELDIVVEAGSRSIDGAKVVKADLIGSNDVIQVIDSAAFPKE
jgi:uncharacterized surface protein with fasciclin (FAS1) repeats